MKYRLFATLVHDVLFLHFCGRAMGQNGEYKAGKIE
jgi:hypothetical protein